MHKNAQVLFITGEDLWLRGHGPNHPLKPERLERTHQLLEEQGAFAWDSLRILPPRMAGREELALFHTDEYLQAVQSMSQGNYSANPRRYNFGPGDNPVFHGMYHSEGLKVGSALQAAEALVREEATVAFSYSGGLHHGGPNRASGFCVFNDAAVAIHWLKAKVEKIFYLDVDVHHGDGVQNAFYEDPSVFTFSIHQDPRTLFPGTGFLNETGQGPGAGFCANLPLPRATDDEIYLNAFHQTAIPLINRFQPDILVTQLGVDTHYRDPLAQLNLTTHAHEMIFQTLAKLDLPWLALGGGGYDLDVVPRSWALAVGAMAGKELPAELPRGYRHRFGGRWLRDEDQPGPLPTAMTNIQSAAEEILDRFLAQFQLD